MHVCNRCGTMHTASDAVCCGEAVMPFALALDQQGKLFELTGNEKAQNVLQTLKANAEAAAQKVAATKNKLIELEIIAQAASDTLMNFYKLTIESGVNA